MPRRYEDQLEKEIAANRELRRVLNVARPYVQRYVDSCTAGVARTAAKTDLETIDAALAAELK